MSERVSEERLRKILAEDATKVGCDSCSNHEVGLLAKEVRDSRRLLARIQEWAQLHHKNGRDALLKSGSILMDDIEASCRDSRKGSRG